MCQPGFILAAGKCQACTGSACTVPSRSVRNINTVGLAVGLSLGLSAFLILVVMCRIYARRRHYELKSNLRHELLYSGGEGGCCVGCHSRLQ